MKILVIDDDPLALELLGLILADMGEVETALGGVRGLAAAARFIPDLILCDLVMPDVDGVMVCRHLKSDVTTRSIPVLCISASVNESEELAALEAGAVDFIKKPLSPPLVRARVKTQIALARQTEMLMDLARRDPLTGIFNRRYFDERLAEEWARHRRAQEPMAVAMVDVDWFKEFNDHYGHVKGDQCLMAVADRLRNAARRPGELAARYGGEEFSMVLPLTSASEAEKFGHWICDDLRSMAYPHDASPRKIVTGCVGIASAIPDDTIRPSDLIKRADQALYQAKRAGRDRHAVATEI